MKKICVFGSYKPLDPTLCDVALLGEKLAKNGFTVISGGFGGTMEDISRGARQAGGHTIGVTYYKFKDLTTTTPNPFIVEEIVTESLFERIERMMLLADGFIVLPGGTGTLLELAAVLEHINKSFMPPKPIIALGAFWQGLVSVLRQEEVLNAQARDEKGFKHCAELVTVVTTVDEVVDYLKNILR